MPTFKSDPIASTRWYVPFCGRSGGPRTRRPPSPGNGHGCGWPLERVAGWVGGGIAAVFFASLERCSCVNVRTQDDLLDDEQRDSEAPLMFDDGNGIVSSTASGASVARRGGSRTMSDKTNGGGIGYYGNISV
ncbi:hypothetical protein PR202_ga12990 [Eleusine coracana subsp. coracana]|uniref:Uncharacterized protein n=1 Tax=Eleusine coracana subsp. coracana TaxID=191504 RepID=A0AAV5CDI3_ELECO|nr:hypothetical protein PR202_ga12990 [Eleusine coracana subsp. coracana]